MTVRRQARGERRMAELQDAAAAVFAEVGYEAATTNAIAARAGVSPGTLYQFYGNKEAIAQALADRYLEALREAHASLTPEHADLPLDELIDRMADPMVAVNVANPGFKALFGRPDMPEKLVIPTRNVHAAVFGRLDAVFAARCPDLDPVQRGRTVMVTMQLFGGLIPMIVAAAPEERPALVVELKKVLRGYLAPVLGEGSS
ncbi:TetR/AcrR family transcriptional regulator [Saccharothrix variisporea]|uniref:TetR family transcriptional regulator n=1 Tax=Saccharothrix variisporea TaxID=543527 RepID=A0A495X585_9PSEU|nr:TetR/AcrR family transcriptional regulator [Saccharothrix variisporea]RKT68385.1 TetR family transcriptional regulator [Saccharothrix variisporea]